jgi:xanthine dehydrogenase molybdopterin-binding subunit B
MSPNPSLAKHPLVDDWLSIGADGRVRLLTGKVDIGQRISTAVALVAAAELAVDFARIDVAPVETGRSPATRSRLPTGWSARGRPTARPPIGS